MRWCSIRKNQELLSQLGLQRGSKKQRRAQPVSLRALRKRPSKPPPGGLSQSTGPTEFTEFHKFLLCDQLLGLVDSRNWTSWRKPGTTR